MEVVGAVVVMMASHHHLGAEWSLWSFSAAGSLGSTAGALSTAWGLGSAWAFAAAGSLRTTTAWAFGAAAAWGLGSTAGSAGLLAGLPTWATRTAGLPAWAAWFPAWAAGSLGAGVAEGRREHAEGRRGMVVVVVAAEGWWRHSHEGWWGHAEGRMAVVAVVVAEGSEWSHHWWMAGSHHGRMARSHHRWRAVVAHAHHEGRKGVVAAVGLAGSTGAKWSGHSTVAGRRRVVAHTHHEGWRMWVHAEGRMAVVAVVVAEGWWSHSHEGWAVAWWAFLAAFTSALELAHQIALCHSLAGHQLMAASLELAEDLTTLFLALLNLGIFFLLFFGGGTFFLGLLFFLAFTFFAAFAFLAAFTFFAALAFLAAFTSFAALASLAAFAWALLAARLLLVFTDENSENLLLLK